MTGTRVVTDPVVFEVFKNTLSGLADEMAITILRTAHSQIVAESMDYSAALCDADGNVVAQANTIPVHLGSIPEAMAAVLRAFGGDLGDGDVYILNDPDDGGMHLPDVFAVMPVFALGELAGFAVCVANHADIGGWAPGSMSVQSTTIFAEGLQLPPTRLVAAGRLDDGILRIILRNVREPELFRGDLESQLAACTTGAAGIRRLAAQHGLAGYRVLCHELLDYSDARLRTALAEATPGSYEFEDHLDDDGLTDKPVTLKVKATLSGSGLRFDFTGTSPQVGSALNATASFTKSACYAAVQAAIGGDVPPNSGMYRAMSFVIPEASILQGRRPAARGARGLTGHRLLDVALGVLAQIFPGRIPAGGDGGPNSLAVGVIDGDGTSRVVWDVMCGSWGARADKDGIDGASSLGANLANTPIEELERSGLVRIEGYGLLPDTGGPGRFRGGLSTFRDVLLLEETALLQVRSDRRRFPSYGLDGGLPGAPSLNLLTTPDGEQTLLATKPSLTIGGGTRHRHITAGGGGYGDPYTRDPDLVLRDVIAEKVSVAGAARDYGVVVTPDGPAIDMPATAALRANRHTDRKEIR
ncbi:hydantoinase B/oxoprolinase family protein [Dactylosporangium sp. CA-092794]|uniref:hydantoinase B/oxoprolinase family protein n=1 Tax=Dactylosporangium sp. CA-092794 TaxID=3239929 RepID=UPI003D8B6DF8